MSKIILPLLLASCFFLPAGCKKENANTSINELLLSKSKWKVVETTYANDDTTFTSGVEESGGFYLELYSNHQYIYTTFPYTSQKSGAWNYSSSDKKLILEFGNSPVSQAYDVIKVTKDRLLLSIPLSWQFVSTSDNFVIYELHPY